MFTEMTIFNYINILSQKSNNKWKENTNAVMYAKSVASYLHFSANIPDDWVHWN